VVSDAFHLLRFGQKLLLKIGFKKRAGDLTGVRKRFRVPISAFLAHKEGSNQPMIEKEVGRHGVGKAWGAIVSSCTPQIVLHRLKVIRKTFVKNRQKGQF
jgi:hypothetical protein